MATPTSATSRLKGSGLPLYLLTYNCARQRLNPVGLSKHLLSVVSPTAPLPELIIVALQEFAPLTTSFIGGRALDSYWSSWRDAISLAGREVLSPTEIEGGNGYVEVARHNVGMTALAVYARRPENVKWTQYAGVGCGVWEMGNKGGVGIKVGYSTVNDGESSITELVFLGAHLAAHEYMLERRNKDWEAIARGTVFQDFPTTFSQQKVEEERIELLGQTPSTDILQDGSGLYTSEAHMFVMGDFNYRTHNDRPKEGDSLATFKWSSSISVSKPLQQLFARDQLTAEKDARRTLHGFTEAPIDFPPSYKFINPIVPGIAADLKYSTHRWPSWCDRILWFKGEGSPDTVKVLKYDAIMDLTFSDHKPVALHADILLGGIQSIAEGGYKSPFVIRKEWRNRRAAARILEIVVGLVMALLTTLPGFCIIFTILLGIAGIRFLL